MKLKQQIALTKKFIKIVPTKRNDKCKGYYPGCFVCEIQLLKGRLYDFLADLEFELKGGK